MSSLLATAAELRRAAIVALAAAIVAGCASSSGGSMKKGREAELAQDYDARRRRTSRGPAASPLSSVTKKPCSNTSSRRS
jgi:hypothetical protein